MRHGEEHCVAPSLERSSDSNVSSSWSEAVRPNCFSDLVYGDMVRRRKLNCRESLVQTDLDVAHPIDLADRHAHGVGADRSVHAKDRLSHLLELGPGNRGKECDCYSHTHA